MRKIFLFLMGFGILLSVHFAFAAPTSTIIQNLFLTGLTPGGNPCLILTGTGLISTSTCLSGGTIFVSTSSLGSYTIGNLSFFINSSTISATSGIQIVSSTGALAIFGSFNSSGTITQSGQNVVLDIVTSTSANTFTIASSSQRYTVTIPPRGDQYFAPSTTIPTNFITTSTWVVNASGTGTFANNWGGSSTIWVYAIRDAATSTAANTFTVSTTTGAITITIPPRGDQYFAPSTTIPTSFLTVQSLPSSSAWIDKQVLFGELGGTATTSLNVTFTTSSAVFASASGTFSGGLSVGTTTLNGGAIFYVATSSITQPIINASTTGAVTIPWLIDLGGMKYITSTPADANDGTLTTSTPYAVNGLHYANAGNTGVTNASTTLTFQSIGGLAVLQMSGIASTSQLYSNSSTIQFLYDASGNQYSTTTLSNPVTVAQGGTNKTSFTKGSVVFASGTTILGENNANLFWDNVNNALALRTSTIKDTLTIGGGGVTITSPSSFDGTITPRIYKGVATGLTLIGVTGNTTDFGFYTPAGIALIENMTATNNVIFNRTSGSTAVGTTTPAYQFVVNTTVGMPGLAAAGTGDDSICRNNGQITVNAGVTTCLVSSKRFKHDIAPLTSGLGEVMQLNPVSYLENGTNKPNVGLIAEDVILVDPRLVATDTQNLPRAVKYENLTAILVKAIQDQQKEIDAIKSGVASSSSGINTTDTVTGKPYCMQVRKGKVVAIKGMCK